MVAPIRHQNAPESLPDASAGELKRDSTRLRASSTRVESVELGLTPLGGNGRVSASREALKRRNNPRSSALPSDRSESSEARLHPSAIVSTAQNSTEIYVLARQTENRLLVLQKEVAECKSVDEAANFTRYLQNSGILALIETQSPNGPLAVNGSAIRKLCAAILSDCGDLYRNGKATPRYAASDIAEINRKLDIIAGHISKL